MSFLTSLVGGPPREQKTVDVSNLLWQTLAGQSSKAGVSVNTDAVLRIATAYACVRVLAEDIGKLPVRILRERDDGTKERATKHPLYSILSLRPNDWQTSVEWRQTMMLHALMTPGAYSWINRAGNGRVMELVPLLPGNVVPKQIPRTLDVVYEVRDGDGVIGVLPRSEIFTIKGLSWNGLTGLDIVRQGRDAFGLAIATEESQARLHSNGARPGGILTTEKTLTDSQVERLRSQFAGRAEGLENAFRTLLLDNGLDFKPWAMTGVDSQHLETRKHQIEEICRLFRVFPSIIGHSDKTATFASAESFFKAHAIHSLQPWVSRWEQAISRDLLLPGEVTAGYYAKLDLRGLMQADDDKRAAYYESAVTKACWMTRNEVRRLEDLDPLPGLDEPLTPLNMQAGDGQNGADPGAEGALMGSEGGPTDD